MHWIIYAELKKFADQLGPDAWDRMLAEAKLDRRGFAPGKTHPDSDALALVQAAAKLTRRPADDVLAAFGEFIVPDLLKFYGNLVKPGWTALDVIEHAEQAIHTIVRLNEPTASPPKLRSARPSRREVVIRYDSGRRMCAVARGIAKGVADHFEERVAVSEPQCMGAGAEACELRVRALS